MPVIRYTVRFAPRAEADLDRLFDFIEDRDPDSADRAAEAFNRAVSLLATSPFSCRKAASSDPLLRELVIPFGHSGYIALFRISGAQSITVLALRHQRESDFY